MIRAVDNFLAHFFNNEKIIARKVIPMSIGKEESPLYFPFKIFLSITAILKGNNGKGSIPA